MKRTLLLVAVFTVGAAFSGFAQTLTLDYPITVSVASDPIDLSGVTDTVSFGTVGFSTTNLSNQVGGQPRSTIENNGYATLDYTARASVTAGSWMLGTAPANNVAVMYAIFTEPLSSLDDTGDNSDYCRDVAVSDFGTEDRLSGTAIRASSTVLAHDAAELKFKGYSVPTTDSTRSLRYRLDTPTSGDTSQQTITVTIGAVDASS